MAKKTQAACPAINGERLLLDMQSADETVRGEAVRALCPCHAGWAAFERHVGLVLKATGDRSRAVRLHALHVFDDAARMQFKDELGYFIQEAEEKARGKRPSRFRPSERERAARRGEKLRHYKPRG